jgi:hypothetical protein
LKERQDILSKRRQLLAASALVPILGALSRPATLQAMIYTFFVCVYLAPFVIKAARERSAHENDLSPAKPSGDNLAEDVHAQIKNVKEKQKLSTINFALVLIGAGMISECLAWVSELFAQTTNPTLLHPQLFPDLFLALFFYVGLAIAWLLLLKRFQFALKEVFFVSFMVALLNLAQAGGLLQICERLVSDPISALLTLASLLVVGGSIVSLGFVAGDKITATEKKPALSKLLTKYALSFILIALVPYLTCLGGGFIGKPLGLCPDKKPIWDAPLI